MKTIKYLFMIMVLASICACTKDKLLSFQINETETQYETMLKFDSENDLANFADQYKDSNTSVSTKASSAPSGFISLWDSNRNAVLSKLSPAEISEAKREGLEYEPEDEIIVDPVFAKILNPRREVSVNGKTYRYIKTGVIVYDKNADIKLVDNFAPEQYSTLKHKDEVSIGKGVNFIRIEYQIPIYYTESPETKAPILEPGLYSDKLILKDGISIPISDVKMVEYAQGSGDANGFQKTISSIFGTSVVAENYFDSKHRMKLRTFAQDFVVYTSVGMTVRMQQKSVGIWWRKKAQEFRYGWTAVECHYTYKGPSFPSGVTFQNADVLLHSHANYYSKPIVLFSVPIVDYKVTDKKVSTIIKSLLQKNKSKINVWMNNNPEYKDNPYSVFSANKTTEYSVIFPQYEETATNDGREQVNWDFRVHAQAGVKIGAGGLTPTFSPVSDPEKIEISRGEIYAAVKYGNAWKACVISTK